MPTWNLLQQKAVLLPVLIMTERILIGSWKPQRMKIRGQPIIISATERQVNISILTEQQERKTEMLSWPAVPSLLAMKTNTNSSLLRLPIPPIQSPITSSPNYWRNSLIKPWIVWTEQAQCWGLKTAVRAMSRIGCLFLPTQISMWLHQ